MKRNREGDEDRAPGDDPSALIVRRIETASDGSPSEEKQKTAPALLGSTGVVYKLSIDPVKPKFKAWLFKSEKKSFTRGEIEKVWKIWIYIRTLACHAGPAYNNHLRRDEHFIRDNFKHFNNWCGSFQIVNRDTGMLRRVGKEEYFDWLLENTIPEQVFLGTSGQVYAYNFPDLTCRQQGCGCNMEPEEMKRIHHWDLDRRCPPKTK